MINKRRLGDSSLTSTLHGPLLLPARRSKGVEVLTPRDRNEANRDPASELGRNDQIRKAAPVTLGEAETKTDQFRD
jgi:hypothetical protein